MLSNNDDKAQAEKRIAELKAEYATLQQKNNEIVRPALQAGFFDNLSEAEKHQKREKLSAALGTIPERIEAIVAEIKELEIDNNITSKFSSPSAANVSRTPTNPRR